MKRQISPHQGSSSEKDGCPSRLPPPSSTLNASSIRTPIRHASALAVCTLAAIAAWEPQPVQAADRSPAPTVTSDVVVPVAPVPAAVAQAATPETSAAPEFSAATPETTGKPAQYYQYQVPTAPVAPAPSAPAAPELPSSSPWVIPSAAAPAPTAKPTVTVPPQSQSAPQREAPAPAPLATPTSPGDLAVQATDVQIVGADAELQQLIRSRIRTQPGGQTNQAQLKQDVAEILDTGLFANASVTSRPNPQGLSVVFQVEPIVVRSLQLSGAQVLTLDVANQLLQPQLGQVVRPSVLAQGAQRIKAWYTQNGYVLAQVSLQPTREGVVLVQVAEGLVGDIQIRFLNREGRPVDEQGRPIQPRTQVGFVRQQIQLQPGQVFREDVARQDLNRLIGLGIFENANVTFEGDVRRATVVYNLVESSARGFNFGGGYNDDLGIYGTISYQDANFAGLAQRIGANVQVGSRDVQFDGRFQSPYRDTDPATPGYGANVFRRSGLSRVFDEDIQLANGSQVRERRTGGGVNLDRPLGPEWNGSLGVNYTRTSLRDRDGNIARVDARGNPLSFSGTGQDDLTTVSFTATRDLRDNAVNTASGSVLTLSTEQSIPIGRGNILSNRLQANYAQFIPVDLIKGTQGDQPQVLAFNVQGGTTVGDLPPYSAYVLGGLNSVRGYENGDVATSRSYLQATAEYRFPIYRFIGGVAFTDFATDLGSSDSVLGEPGVQRGKPGSGFGYGVGLRLNSPIGIIRADFGINDQGGSLLRFGFGQRF